MAKLSRQTKEIIKTVIVLLIVAMIAFFYIIYPLNRVDKMMARTDIDEFNPDSLPANDFILFTDSGLVADSLRVESDGLTTIACLSIQPSGGSLTSNDSVHTVKGTVCLLHADGQNRDSVLWLAKSLIDSGFVVIAVDQRAAGRSSGKYFGEGQYEAEDLLALVSYFELRQQIVHPLSVIGFDRGAEAGLLAAQGDDRIDRVVAIDPYLSTDRWQDILKTRHEYFWFPFHETMFWWWYNISSSYAASYREADQVEAVACRTLLFVPEADLEDEEVVQLTNKSDLSVLEIKASPLSQDDLLHEIMIFLGE